MALSELKSGFLLFPPGPRFSELPGVGSRVCTTPTMSAPPGAQLWASFEAWGGASTNLVVSCGCYMLSSAGMSVFNKLAVQALDLPISLVLIQMLFTVASIATRPSSVHIGSRKDALRWGLSVPMLFAAMLVRPRHAQKPCAHCCWRTGLARPTARFPQWWLCSTTRSAQL
jgi:hypothetical protein